MITGAVIAIVMFIGGYYANKLAQEDSNVVNKVDTVIRNIIFSKKAKIIDTTPIDLGDEENN